MTTANTKKVLLPIFKLVLTSNIILSAIGCCKIYLVWYPFFIKTRKLQICTLETCGDAFPIEGVLVATYLLSVEALPHCRYGVANKNRIV